MKSRLQRENKGFTIIEVLIVLAIAGLILLIVFLAVPALQRNSRNTQRRNDVSAALGAISEFSSNNNGRAIASTGDINAAVANANFSVYPANQVYYTPNSAIPAVPGTIGSGAGNATTVTLDNMIVVVGAKCTAGSQAAPTADTGRAVAVVFAVETGGDPTYQCQDS